MSVSKIIKKTYLTTAFLSLVAIFVGYLLHLTGNEIGFLILKAAMYVLCALACMYFGYAVGWVIALIWED